MQLIEDGFVAPWATEYQLQAAVTTGSMRELLGQLPQWSVRDVYNHRFKRVEWPSTDSGTYWIVVELGH